MNTHHQLLKQIKDIVSKELQLSEKRVKQELTQEIHATEGKLREEIHATEQKLLLEIKDRQKDTIEVLSELMHTSHTMNEKRIKRIEDTLELPHSQ